VQIVGVGFDAPSVNAGWAEEEEFEFELWTDSDAHTLAVWYGAGTTSSWFPSRVTKVLDADGVLRLEYAVSDLGTHPNQVLEDVRILFGD
jgi:peroxiredoxin